MSASEFIILRIHPDHPKVLRLAELTGDSPCEACGRAVAWFRYVDQHFSDAKTGLGRVAFARILNARKRRGKLDYFSAMQDAHINWISVDDEGCIEIVEYDANFDRSSKRRAIENRRKAAAMAVLRRKEACGVAQSCATDAQQKRHGSAEKAPPQQQQQTHRQTDDRQGAVVEALKSAGVGNPDVLAELAAKPGITPELVRAAHQKAKGRAGGRDPTGLMVRLIRDGDWSNTGGFDRAAYHRRLDQQIEQRRREEEQAKAEVLTPEERRARIAELRAASGLRITA